jgi:hypothetical protein
MYLAGALRRIEQRAATAEHSVQHGKHLGVTGISGLKDVRQMARDALETVEGDLEVEERVAS